MERRQGHRISGRRRGALLVAVLIVGLAACGGDDDASGGSTSDQGGDTDACAERHPLRLAAGVVNAHGPLHVAMEQGYYEDLCLDVERINMQASPDIAQGLVNGTLDAGPVSSTALLNIWSAGLPVTAIMSPARGGDRVSIAVAPDSGIETIDDLEGKKVGAQVGSIGHQIVLAALDSVGLSVDDIELLNAQNPDLPGLLASGSVDAIGTLEPFGTAVEQNGSGEVLVRGADLIGVSANFMLVSDDYLQENPDLVQALVEGTYRAMQFLRDQPEEAAEAMTEYLETDVEEIVQQNSFYDWNPLLDPPTEESLENDGAFLIGIGDLPSLPEFKIDRQFEDAVVRDHPDLVEAL